MLLTPEQRAIGRRNFLRALAGTPALVTLGAAAAMKAPVRGGPVRIGLIGVGGQGRALLGRVNPAYGTVVAMADINPASLAKADEVLAKRTQAPAKHYVEWKEMLENENVEAVIVAVPLWAHADVVVPCFEAGKHVLCEKMMAFDVDGCRRMMTAATQANRVLEIGYQRNYNPVYQAAYEGIIQRELLGDVYHVRLAWHRNGNWRRPGGPPTPDYDPSRWGYPTFEHLWNWRLYWKYSRGLFAELCSHQLNATNWFLASAPTAVRAYGGVHRYKDGREAHDHIYSIFEYPNGLTATFTSIESNAFDQRYETFFGTKATLVMYNESEALLFDESADGAAAPTAIEVSSTPSGAGVEASETKPANNGPAKATAVSGGPNEETRASATELEISAFCSAIRVGTPLKCGPERAFDSARACIAACETAKSPQTRVAITT
jgi:predicted dehydrogenase